jgi:hypothetical protein
MPKRERRPGKLSKQQMDQRTSEPIRQLRLVTTAIRQMRLKVPDLEYYYWAMEKELQLLRAYIDGRHDRNVEDSRSTKM